MEDHGQFLRCSEFGTLISKWKQHSFYLESTNSSGSSGADDNNLVYENENRNSKDSDAASTDDDSDSESEDDDEDDEEEEPHGISSISGDRHSDGTTASYSSLEDDDAIEAHNLSNSNKYGNVDNADYGNGNAKIGKILLFS